MGKGQVEDGNGCHLSACDLRLVGDFLAGAFVLFYGRFRRWLYYRICWRDRRDWAFDAAIVDGRRIYRGPAGWHLGGTECPAEEIQNLPDCARADRPIVPS
ncbi:hypothetical protein VB735_02890 [Halotia wernerae UHCC 0503]|nr:hypothetical protein [Halotia wernerae UHCC 0503]